MIDFPNSPSVGDTYNSGSGAIYIWDGVAWSIATSQTATALSRNRIVNPAMQISQELGATATTTALAYVVDQWLAQVSGISFSAQKSTATLHQIQIGVTTGKALAASDYMGFMQPIEGQRLFDFFYGAANAQPSVLRFDVVCSVAGTYGVSIRNGAANRSLVLPFTVPTANVWQTIVLPIPGDTAGTWVVDNTGAMSISIVFAAGTTYTTAVSGWQAGNFLAPTGITNGAATTNNIFYISNVGLYLDPLKTGLAPPFQMPDYGLDLMECERYLTFVGVHAQVPAIGWLIVPWYTVADMRASPSLSINIAGSITNVTIRGDLVSDNRGGYFQVEATSANGAVTGRQYKLSARM